MLAISPIVDDEPPASAATAPKLDKPAKYDARAINRRAVQLWPVLRDHIVGLKGFPVGDICRLSPAYIAQDPGRARPPGSPQLKEFRGPSPHENDGGPGAWRDLGTGASGPDLISLIEFLGQTDRRTAADFLERLCGRMVVLP